MNISFMEVPYSNDSINYDTFWTITLTGGPTYRRINKDDTSHPANAKCNEDLQKTEKKMFQAAIQVNVELTLKIQGCWKLGVP